MRIMLHSIVLYSHDGRTRVVTFKPNQMNIITGESKTGKSAIIHIVNYCLGSSDCHIPEGVIRRKVAWYAVVLTRDDGEVFIARQNPEKGRATSYAIHIRVGDAPSLPRLDELSRNIDNDALKDFLTRYVGIDENLHVPSDEHTREPLVANFAHSRIYCFQEQGLIDNKNQLFFNQSDSFVGQAIKDTLPYFLGAVSSNELSKQQELSQLRREVRLLERKLDTAVSWRQAAENRAGALLAEARQVGLVAADLRQASLEQTFSALQSALQVQVGISEPTDMNSELKELFVERDNLRSAFSEAKDRLDEARIYGSNRGEYENELAEQSARLEAVHLFPDVAHDIATCPLCLSKVPSVTPKLQALRTELSQVTGRIGALRRQNPRLQSLIGELERQAEDIAQHLRENQNQINSVIKQNDALRRQQETSVRRSRIQGRISAFLETESVEDQDDISIRLSLLRRRVEELTSDIAGESYEDRLRNVEYLLSDYMTQYAKQLQLEHSEGRTRLDLRRLTVVADTKHGSIRLENMGSGDNWVGCHVLTHMALHRVFIERDRPVPAFLILDQPSKAHYPPSEEQIGSREVDDDDRAAVIRLFHFIYERTKESGFQTVVIDHADEAEPWFQDAILERWRGGRKLVPDDWAEQT